MTIEETVATLTETVAALTSKVDGQEKVTQQIKTDIGESKKELGETKEALEAQVESLKQKGGQEDLVEKVQKTIDKVNELDQALSKKDVGSSSSPGSTDVQEELKTLEAGLSDKQKEAADAVFNDLEESERIRVAGDPKEKLALLTATVKSVPSVPGSLFAKPDDNEKPENKYLKLFKGNQQDADYVPAGAVGTRIPPAVPRGDKKGDQQVTRRLPGGVIPKGDRKPVST